MKSFTPLIWDAARCRNEVQDFRVLLANNSSLTERKQIVPFFRHCVHLAAFLGSYHPDIDRFDRIAFEYDLFGDFSCDMVVGHSAKRAYNFIEFEEAESQSLFRRQGKKSTREWSAKFDHGYSQIIDWFGKPRDSEKSDDFDFKHDLHGFGAREDGRAAISTGAAPVIGTWRRRGSSHLFNVQAVVLTGDLSACPAIITGKEVAIMAMGTSQKQSWVQKTPNVCGGDACIRNTRITVHGLVHYQQLGLSDQRLLEVIQGLTQEDLAAAWDYYACHRAEIDEAIRLNEEA